MTLDKYQLDHNIGFLVNDISRLMSTEYNKIMKPLGLTRAQWRVVVHLHRADGLTQSELADLLGAGKVSVGGLIDRLEHSGWVERRDDPQDRRSNRVFLTKKGRAIEKEMEKTGRELTHQTLRNLGQDERAHLVDLLIAVKSNLLQIGTDGDDDAPAAILP
jgi:MarR family transcriptional regulator for hemolysin